MGSFNLFQNTEEMQLTFEKAQRVAVAHVTTMMMEEIQKEIDDLGIGLRGEFNKIYEPTHEFREAWVGSELSETIKNRVTQFVEGQMGYDPWKIKTVRPDEFIHGSNVPFKGGGTLDDSREWLPDIIFGGNNSDLWGGGWWTQPRDAWSKAEKRFEKSWGKWVRDGFAISGIYLS